MRRSQGIYCGGGLSESSCALPHRLAMERVGVLPAAPDQVWTAHWPLPVACCLCAPAALLQS